MEMPRIGPLLANVLFDKVVVARRGEEAWAERAEDVGRRYRLAAAGHIGTSESGSVPVVAMVPRIMPDLGEGWSSYKERALNVLMDVDEKLRVRHGLKSDPLVAANGLQANGLHQQIRELTADREIGLDLIELDPLLQVIQMDDAAPDVGLPSFRSSHPSLDGSGVRVAVLDSGIDANHPSLEVADAISTSGEDIGIPGVHGTHCAGSIASRDDIFPGVAPRVTLMNVKVLSSTGQGQHTMISRGIDGALDRGANILSLSLGFNHLPRWSNGGHGWACTVGDCPLCTAVTNATVADNALAVVAAGNEHERAEHLRALGHGGAFDTELGCPGQARAALTVGAIAKGTHTPASFSSRGPTSFGVAKPDVCAPGVNITSTIPVPREPDGAIRTLTPRETIFGRLSGTSMATPILAGAVALLVQEKIDNGEPWTAQVIREELLGQFTTAMDDPAATGVGRLALDRM